MIGGSVGLAARGAGWDVIGVDRPGSWMRLLLRRHRPALDPQGGARRRLVVLAAPISKVTDLVAELPPTDALVTDVASTKMAVVRGGGTRLAS